MFVPVALFEFRHQTRQPIFWIASLLFFLAALATVAAPEMELVSSPILRNSPAALVATIVPFGFLFTLMTAAFASDVVVRDDLTGFGPIVRSTPITKATYLYGRFTGAFLAVLAAFASVPAGFMLGALAPWVDPEVLGPLRAWPLLQVFGVLAVPSLFVTTALCFGLATATRSATATYVAIIALLASYMALPGLMDRLGSGVRSAVAVLEPLGFLAVGLTTRYWTPDELNTQAPALAGVLLANRACAVAMGLAALAAAYRFYRFAEPGRRRFRQTRPEPAQQSIASAPRIDADYGVGSLAVQTLVRTRFVFRWIVTSPAFVILLLVMTAFTIPALWTANEFYEVPSLPVTRVLIEHLGTFGVVLGLVVATWYAGELVWLDRDRRVDALVDAAGAPSWVLMLPKVLGVIFVLGVLQLTGVAAGMAVQAAKGHFDFQLAQYLNWHVLPGLVDIALVAVLTVFLHAVASHKVVGWGLTVLFIALFFTAPDLGLDHNLLLYSSVPGTAYSEMNGQGGVEQAATWFRLYWSSAAVLLLVFAYGLWRRGPETRLRPRLRRLPARLNGPAGLIGAAAFAAAVGLGGYIYINTFVWNGYSTQRDDQHWWAAYEKALLPFENTPQPVVEEVRMQVSIEPRVPRLSTDGAYTLRNSTDAPLTHAHVRFQPWLEVVDVSLQGARLERKYAGYNYHIFRFDRPLPPGGRRTLSFATRFHERGFPNDGPQTRVVANGSFITNREFAPILGMDRSDLLQDPAVRRRHGLPAQLQARSRDDPLARRRNYVGADWVRMDLTVVTDSDQTPVAPGRVVSERTWGGRRSVSFRSDTPILNFFSVHSARYAARRTRHAGVDIAVFHHPGHGRNVDRMITALKASLDYAQANFSPYQFGQISIVEFPAYGDYAQSFPQTIPYSENAGFIADLRRPVEVDYVTALTAHELAHQWWAHQLIGADAEGALLLSETLAEYTSLMVLEKLYGPAAVEQALRFDMDGYLNDRSDDLVGERPLVRVDEKQSYLAYNKGALVMYRLRLQLGEEVVNRALRRLLREHAFQGPPYPTSRDFVAALRAESPAVHQRLITELFEQVGPPELALPASPSSASGAPGVAAR